MTRNVAASSRFHNSFKSDHISIFGSFRRSAATLTAAFGLALFGSSTALAETSPAKPAASVAAVGGPFDAILDRTVIKDADPQFSALFASWGRLGQADQGVMAVPSLKPVAHVEFTSLYGVRSDPFRGSAAMHSGVDIPGTIGTPIYATADGIVGRAGWAGGYGNLVEVNHGRGIQTRYGHLSRILVAPNARVKRGDLIALMGSTGRSTGSHLHYEVRLDGHAVNPVPFLRSVEYAVAVQQRSSAPIQVALGGPDE